MKMNIKHIVFICPAFPDSEEPSTWVPYIQVFLRNFKQQYPTLNIRLIAVHFPKQKSHFFWHGIEVFSLGGQLKKLPKRIFIWKALWEQLKAIHQKVPIDIIHNFWVTDLGVLGQQFAKRYGINHVLSYLGQDVKINNRYLRFIDFNYSKHIFITSWQFGQFKKHFQVASKQLIPWGVDASMLPSLSLPRSIDLIAAGSLSALKRHHILLEVTRELYPFFPNIKVVLIGNGPLEETYQTYIDENGLSEVVEMKGQLKHLEVLALLGQSKILVHTSEYEGMGYVFAEALEAGAYTVSFEVGIAGCHSKSIVVKNKAEMEKTIKQLLLNGDWDFSPANTFPISRTIAEHLAVYCSF